MNQRHRQQTSFVLGSLFVVLPALLFLWLVVLGLLRIGGAARDELLVLQTREKTLELSVQTQEAIIEGRTADLKHALRVVEDREEQLQVMLYSLQERENAIQALSAPILPIKPGVLVAPLIGVVDGSRAAILLEKALREVEQQKTEILILDVTGLEVIDGIVGQAIFALASAVRLLGTQLLLVGIRPEVAQSMLSMQIDLRSVNSYLRLQEAVDSLERS